MTFSFVQRDRRGVSLTEILIGIVILGIGVISLATLFPLGLLRMRKSVNDTRAVYLGRSALAETRVRNLIAPPYGPLANVFRADPLLSNGEPDPGPPGGSMMATIPFTGSGLPVVIDPLGVMNNAVLSQYPEYPTFDAANLSSPTRNDKRLGYLYDTATSTIANHGIPRFRGNIVALALAQQIFSAPDDMSFIEENRALPVQGGTNSSPQYLTPTNGLPFTPGTMFREPRYSWFIIARKMSAAQAGSAAMNGRSDDDDNMDGLITTTDIIDADEWNNPGPDGRYGFRSGTLAAQDANGNGLPDDAEDDTPVGPFEISIAVFYQRDFQNGEKIFRFVYPFGPDGAPGKAASSPGNSDGDDDNNGISDFYADGTPDWNEFLWTGTDDAPLDILRIPLTVTSVPPEIPKDGFVLDATYNLDPVNPLAAHYGHWYRVLGKETIVDPVLGNTLQIRLASPMKAYMRWMAQMPGPVFRPNGIGTGVFMKGVVGVYEKTVP